MNQTVQKLVERFAATKSPASLEAVVSSVINSQAAQKLFNDIEAEEISRRRALKARRDACPEGHGARIAAAHKRYQAAECAAVAAKRAMHVAEAAARNAYGDARTATVSFDREWNELSRALEATADPRLDAFAKKCIDLCDAIRDVAPIQTFERINGPFRGREELVFSVQPHAEASAALRAAAEEVLELRYLPLGAQEVSRALQERTASLMSRLDPVLGAVTDKAARELRLTIGESPVKSDFIS